MKDYSWLAVFSVFTLVVGGLFTYGNGAHAGPQVQPVQVYIVSTSTPTAPVVVYRSEPQPITVTLPEIVISQPDVIVNESIATSTLSSTERVSSPPPTTSPSGATYTYYVTNNSYTTNESATESETASSTTETVSLTIEGLYQATTTAFVEGQTVLELLSYHATTDPSLALATQDYGEMGVLITAIGGFSNGTDGKYWQYMVNGSSPMIGADQYELSAQDQVVWQFKGFE